MVRNGKTSTRAARTGLKAKREPTTRPRTERKAAAEKGASLDDKLVAIIESQRQLGGAAYPLTIERLAELSGAGLKEVVKGIQSAEKRNLVVVSAGLTGKTGTQKVPFALVVLDHDAGLLAASDKLLPNVLGAVLKGNDSIDLGKLIKWVKTPLAAAFEKDLLRRLDARQLPAGVGALALPKGKFLLFRLSSVIGLMQTAVSPSAATRANGDFESRFASAFQRLDRQSGERNYVPLYDLRRALSDVSRDDFDQGLAELRRGRRFTLDASDGRHDRLSPELQAAGIWESGNLLVYVARRDL